MSKPRSEVATLFAPGAGAAHHMVLPGADPSKLPPVDDHVVEPETRQEMIDGRIVHVAPAHPPHGDRHSELDYVLRASVAPGYVSSTDMLTRTSEGWNFAADASIRKQGLDPETGHRYLEELAFEIVYTQRLSDVTARARQLTGRGVRRVFAVFVSASDRGGVTAGSVKEWSPAEDQWIDLGEDTLIEDPCLRTPIKVRALLNATEADDVVARALVARGNRVLRAREAQRYEQGRAEGVQQGRAEVLRETIFDLCEAWGIEVTAAQRQRALAMDLPGLTALRDHLKAHRRWPEA